MLQSENSNAMCAALRSYVIIVMLSALTASSPALGQSAPESMLIVQYRSAAELDFAPEETATKPPRAADYQPMFAACARSLAGAAQAAGLTVVQRTEDASKLTANLGDPPSTTYRISLIVPNGKVGLRAGSDAILLPNAFTGAGHFAAFLQSKLYEAVREQSLRGADGIVGVLNLAGIAYGSAIHIAASDRALVGPQDIKERTSLAPFGMDAMVGAKGYAGVDLRQGLPAQYQPGGVFTQAPALLLREAVAPELRRHLSLSSTRIVPVLFVADHLSRLSTAQQAKLRSIGQRAALDCSAINYDSEEKELISLRDAGAEILQADRAALRAASLFHQKDVLEKSTDARQRDDLNTTIAMFEALANPETATPPNLATPIDNPPPDAFPAAPETFAFKVCNNKSVPVHVAYVGAEKTGLTRVRGWWQVQPNSCRTIATLKSGDFYFFAQTFRTNPIQVFVAGTKLRKFCIDEKPFNFPVNKTCGASDKRDFSFMHITSDHMTWTL